MFFSHSLESRLLLACARPMPEILTIQQLVQPDLDWQAIVDRAEQYGITPLVYSNLKQAKDGWLVPATFMEQLKERSRWHAFLNMNRYLKLQSILLACQQEAIPVVVLKGAALAPLVYKDISHRPMKDLDLLVRREDLDKADHLLQSLHYVPDESYQSQAWYRAHLHHLAPYVARDRSLVLELHHHIVSRTAPVHIPIDEFWQRTRPIQIAAIQILIFAPEDLLLHLSLHLAYADRFLGKLRDLCDIAETIRWYKEEIDWVQLLYRAQTYEVEQYLYYALWLAQSMVGAEVPAEVLRDLKLSLRRSRFKDLSLKFIAQHAVLRPAQSGSPMPSWLISVMCTALLSQHGTGKIIKTVYQQICQGFAHSARQAAPQLNRLAPLYMLFIHPLVLFLRAIGSVGRLHR